jgi:hypothetical protein
VIGLETRYAIYARDEYRCLYCRCDVEEDPTLDHVIPRKWDGPSRPSNLVTACRECNAAKGDQNLDEYLMTSGRPFHQRRVVIDMIQEQTRKGLAQFRRDPETKRRIKEAKRAEAARLGDA